MLLEKAWAKVNGGYGNILVGNPSEVFRFLTGFSTEQINNKLIEENNYLNILKNSYDSKELVCFSTNKENNVEEMGLIKDHNYVLYDIFEIKEKDNNNQLLLKLKNPIPSDINWKGDWSNESDKWTEELNKQVNHNILEEENKNVFFINVHDLLIYFNRTDICHILFDSFSKEFDNNEIKDLDEPQIFNFYLEKQGKVSITISEYNWKFHKEFNNYSHPTSLVLVEYNPENLDIKNIYTDYENDKDIEKTVLLNEGFYLLWIFKYYLNEEESNDKDKDMKIKILSDNKYRVKYLDPYSNFQVIQQII